ncbi:hypothetical protein SAMN04487948_106189 [Halogranum amylolyticum]|uniref:Uncharacterized protein n=1 Tax=Halogranum amylolyticum TaxID=660520 RepID=A0A1H8TCW0_9EURY|nr:hypothetical protein [Halogranum amylolyticum]SEO88757.1 hypothetical protein SAMN04487948_106189 [Halogranum amylolyticum]
MTTDASLLAAALDVCERSGYRTERPDRGWLPDAIATAPTDATSGSTVEPLFGDTDAPIAVEPLEATDVEPTTMISRLWDNSDDGRRTLFVVPGGEADALAETVSGLLSEPACVAAEDDDGCRTFYNGPDRIALTGGGYALHKTTDPEFRWFEELADDGRGGETSEQARTGSDGKRVVLADGDEEVAVLGDVDGLGCPPASTFPYAYRRNPRDKCFHVTDASGREVGVFTDVRSVRAAAYEPVPMPFVPEHLFDGPVRSHWGVLAVDDDSPRLYTADGRRVLDVE